MIGSTVLNYRIEKLIGTGGMGSVYYATNLNIDQKVAIKVLNKNLSDSTTVRNWFKNEANLLCQLDHPNIVKFLNFVENEDGIFLIMEYVDGVTLEDFITKKNGLIVEERVYELFDQVLDAFSYAHKRGIVHRDIKPANIILTAGDDGEFVVKILDFGIAGFTTSINENKSWIVGTPSYMSPEQVNGDDIDQRSDIYSLGVLLHQMLTGKTPYDATTLSEIVIKDKVLKEPLPRMKDYYAYISEKLQRIVDKAVAKEKKNRYQNCTEFRRAIKQALRPEQISKKIKIISAALILILLGVGVGIWDYNRTKVYYYKDYVEQWGVPQGIGELSTNEFKHRSGTYKFVYTKYKLQRMSYVNSRGNLITHNNSEHVERPTDMLLYYSDNGNVDYVKCLDANGKVLFRKDYNEKLNVAIFQYDDEFATELTLASRQEKFKSAFTNESQSKGKISRYIITHDNNGFISKVEYAAFQNVLVSDNDGVFARKYVVDDLGRVIEEHFLGMDGNPKGLKNGLAVIKHKFNNNNDWIETSYYTIDGQESGRGELGNPIVRIEYDKYGNRSKEIYLNFNGDIVIRNDYNTAGTHYTYDENGNCIEFAFFGIDGQPCYTKEGYAKYQIEYDDYGYISKVSNFDVDNNLCLSNEGVAVWSAANDDNGNRLEMWFFDENNQLIEIANGNAGYKAKFDSLGNQIEWIALGIDKNPCLTKNSTAGNRIEYSKLGKPVKITNLGIDLNPCKDNDGTAIWTAEYDKRGNRTKLTFYDETGEKLQLSNEGIAGWCSVYDENGNETERSFFDIQNKACLINGGYAKWIAKYDDRGNQLELVYYDIANKPTVIKEGYASKKYKYDERGNVIEDSSIDTDGNLASGKLVARYKYDKFDNEIEFSVFDKDNKPAINSSGYFKYIKRHNERNQDIEVCYFGKDGKPTILNGKKYSIIRYEYDNRGNSIQTSFFNTENKPCTCSDGYAKHKSEYNNLGQVIRQTYFDVNGKPTNINDYVPEGMVKYDKWGNMIYIAAGDGKGNLIINPNTGWAIMEKEFDIKGNELLVSYFGTNKKATEPKGLGFAKSVSIYDKNSNKLEQKLYNKSGELRKEKYAIIRYKYDEFNRNNETTYFDCNNKPCNGDNTWHKEVYSMYNGDQAQLCKLYDASGSLIASFKRINGEWVIQTDNSNGVKNAKSSNGDSSLKSIIESAKKECPQIMADGIELSTAYFQGDIGVFVFRLSEVSIYNLSESDKNEFIDTFKKYKDSMLQSLNQGAKVKLIINDKANRKLFEI